MGCCFSTPLDDELVQEEEYRNRVLRQQRVNAEYESSRGRDCSTTTRHPGSRQNVEILHPETMVHNQVNCHQSYFFERTDLGQSFRNGNQGGTSRNVLPISRPNHVAEGQVNCKRKNVSEENDPKQSFRNEKIIQSRRVNPPFDVFNILSILPTWSLDATSKTKFVDISFSSEEGMWVKKLFNGTAKSKDFQLTVLGISRIENPFLHSQYLLKKEELTSRNGHVDELFLFHGTKKENLSNICQNNLDWRMFSEKHKFGQGVSFSPLSTYSCHYSDQTVVRFMLLVKVLVSNAVWGSANMTIPTGSSGVVYDTSIKDDTRVIVKYSDSEFYPLYKIVYKLTTKRVS